MKFRQILFVLLSIMCFSTISAQQLTPKKQQKFAGRVNLTAFAGNTLCDKSYVLNVDWLEYLYWLEKRMGRIRSSTDPPFLTLRRRVR